VYESAPPLATCRLLVPVAAVGIPGCAHRNMRWLKAFTQGLDTMRLKHLHPELRNTFRFIPPIPMHYGWFVRFLNKRMAGMPRKHSCGDVAITTQSLSHGSVRIYRPPGPLSGAGLLWIHGGGMITGAAFIDDRQCAMMARALKVMVVSVEYRLAPEHPFPAALDDCFEAWQWFVEHAGNLGVDRSRMAISGQSAGGGLSACVVQRIHDQGGTQPVAVALLCPMLDDRTAARRELDKLKHRVWNNKNNRAGWGAYLGQAPGSAHVPDYAVAGRRDDLSHLPPHWIAVSDIDLLFEESTRYHQRLQACGVESHLYVVPQAPHGFEVMAPGSQLAKDMFQDGFRFLGKHLSL